MIKIVVAKKLRRLALIMTAAVFVNSLGGQNVYAQEIDLDTLCQKFPLNSRCQGYKSPARQASQVIKLRLKTSGADNEWIRLERNENTVKLLHTTRAKTVFSRVLNGLAGAAPVPVPRVFNFYQWYDHPTTRVAFKPDSCTLLQRLKLLNNSVSKSNQVNGSPPSCAITGTDSVLLAEGMDIRRGQFTIEYKEGDLLRSITFRIPTEDS